MPGYLKAGRRTGASVLIGLSYQAPVSTHLSSAEKLVDLADVGGESRDFRLSEQTPY
jgi:hypothetical protein